MYFGLSEEQQELATAVDRLVVRRAGSVDVRAAAESEAGYDTELWRALAEQIGAAALAVPEEYGGAGFSLLETQVVLEQLGRHLTPSPLLGSGVLATQAVLLAGDAAAAERLLPDLAAGAKTAALAWADESGRWALDGSGVRASETDGGWSLEGRSTLVLDGTRADVLLVLAATPDGLGLFEVAPADAQVEPTPAMDQTLDLAAVTLTGAGATRIGADVTAVLPRLRAVATSAVTALQVGGAQAALDRTVAYLKEREQFGRPLASFQALKHRCADMVVLVETARSMSWAAAWAAAHGPADVDAPDGVVRRAALAKAWCTDAFDHVTSEMVQLHGGIAITWEHDAHLFFKRAHATAQLFGRAHEARRELAGA